MILLLTLFGFALSLIVAINERKSLLSVVSLINVTFFLGYVFRPLIIIFHLDGQLYIDLNVLKEPDSFIKNLLTAYYFYSFFTVGVCLTKRKSSNNFTQKNDHSGSHFSVLLMIFGFLSYISYLYISGFFNGGLISLFEYIYGQRGFYYFRSLSFLFIFGMFGYLIFVQTNPLTKVILLSIAILISVSFYARQHFVIFALLFIHINNIFNDKKNTLQQSTTRIIFTSFMVVILLYSMVFFLSSRNALSSGDLDSLFSNKNNSIELLDYITNSGQITYFDFGVGAMHYQKDTEKFTAHSLLNLFLLPLPSSIYENKPKNFNRTLAEGFPIKTPPSPAFGFNTEIYFNFPYVYFIIGPMIMAFIGIFLKKSFFSIRDSYFNFMLYLFMYSSFFMFIRSGLFSSTGVFIEKFIPFLMLVFIYKLIFYTKGKIS